MATTAEQRRLSAQIAANTRWSREDPTLNAVRGQEGLTRRFEREVDPDNVLDPAERARRVECARRAHFGRLALASSSARSRTKAPAG